MIATRFQLSTKFGNTSIYTALGVEGMVFFTTFNVPSTPFNKTYLQHLFNSLMIIYQLIKLMLNVEGRVWYKI